MSFQPLTLERIHQLAPSVFAEKPYGEMSEKYRFFPTSEIVSALMDNGFVPTRAFESNTRKEDKRGFVKHVVRFRHADMMKAAVVGAEVPEIVLLNSHDGTSSYKLMCGIFRLVCSNGMVVKSGSIDEVSVRHSGRDDLVGQVIEGSYRVIEEAPKAIQQVESWKQIELKPEAQIAFAESAIELRGTSLDVQPSELLRLRRYEDKKDDLWTVMNRVQENLIRGGYIGRNTETGQRQRVRGVKSVDGDTKLNRALWVLTERMAEIAA